MGWLRTRQVAGDRELADYFDHTAPRYAEQHGDPEALIRYRLDRLRHHARLDGSQRVADLGCGHGHHLLRLAPVVREGVGIDFSTGMIVRARRAADAQGLTAKVTFVVDDAKRLESQRSDSFDVVFCIGAFEHMIDGESVAASVYRILAPGGRFVLMTLNGSYVWYRWLAPLLRADTLHFSTDRRWRSGALRDLLAGAGLAVEDLQPWTFIPRGDLPAPLAAGLGALDRIGAALNIACLRGGIAVVATKPDR